MKGAATGRPFGLLTNPVVFATGFCFEDWVVRLSLRVPEANWLRRVAGLAGG